MDNRGWRCLDADRHACCCCSFLLPCAYDILKVLDYNMGLTGNGADLAIYTDGNEGASERRGADPSVKGNQLSGRFTLGLRGWVTQVKSPLLNT